MLRTVILLASLGLVQPLAALELTGSLASFQRGEVLLRDLDWELHSRADGFRGVLTVGSLRTSDQRPWRQLRASCRQLNWRDQRLSCRGGELELDLPGWSERLRAVLDSWELDLRSGQLVAAGTTQLRGAEVAVELSWQSGVAQWRGAVTALPLSQIAGLDELLGRSQLAVADGLINVTLSGQWQSGAAIAATGDYAVEALSFDSESGSVAGAELALAGQLDLALERGGLRVRSARSQLSAGEALFGPLYLSLSEQPALALSWDAWWDREQALVVDGFSLSDGDALSLEGALQLDWEQGVQLLELEISHFAVQFPGAYQRYLASLADGLGWGDMVLAGVASGNLGISHGQLTTLRAELERLDVELSGSRLKLDDLDGTIDYRLQPHAGVSAVSWQRASYYDLAFGPTRVGFRAQSRGFELTEPLRLGLFDGSVDIEQLLLANFDRADARFDFRGGITPVSLRPITEALGWPVLQGTISGHIPQVTLRDDIVRLDGAVVLDLFDGQVKLDALTLERVFGVLPTLAANVTIDNIDLEQMTGAFSFGKIEGRLDGSVSGLRLLNWVPVAFDLDLHTPPDDRSRHRLSQRAVDNLSSIGGGSSASLQATFLRFFEDFSYRELGLSCRLRNHVCTMSGVAPAAKGGYYIVRGKGLPRIDIIGFSRQVDWPKVTARLRQAISDPGAIRFDQ